jgi:peroxiredoxin
MRLRSICCWSAALAGLSVVSACSQKAPPPSSAAAESAKPKPMKYEVKVPLELPKPVPPEVADAAVPQNPSNSAPEVKAELPYNDPQAAELTLPAVVLSEAHAKTCRVRIGDRFPELELADLEGSPQSLAKQMGSQLTVVCFWNSVQPSALQELIDLGPDVGDRFSSHGVAVVGVNVGDDPQTAGDLAKKTGAQFPILCDPQSQAMSQLASEKMPRTYLVDASGKIAWLDIEYSRTTRRDLSQAIRFLLSHGTSSRPQTP